MSEAATRNRAMNIQIYVNVYLFRRNYVRMGELKWGKFIASLTEVHRLRVNRVNVNRQPVYDVNSSTWRFQFGSHGNKIFKYIRPSFYAFANCFSLIARSTYLHTYMYISPIHLCALISKEKGCRSEICRRISMVYPIWKNRSVMKWNLKCIWCDL